MYKKNDEKYKKFNQRKTKLQDTFGENECSKILAFVFLQLSLQGCPKSSRSHYTVVQWEEEKRSLSLAKTSWKTPKSYFRRIFQVIMDHLYIFFFYSYFFTYTFFAFSKHDVSYRWEILEGRGWHWHGAVSPGTNMTSVIFIPND